MATEPTEEIRSDASRAGSSGADRQAGALGLLWQNLLSTPRQFRESVVRHGRPTSDRAASQAVFSNVFLHILPTRIHRHSLRIRATFGLGVISLVLFFLLIITGVALMVYYKPSTDEAYNSTLARNHVFSL